MEIPEDLSTQSTMKHWGPAEVEMASVPVEKICEWRLDAYMKAYSNNSGNKV